MKSSLYILVVLLLFSIVETGCGGPNSVTKCSGICPAIATVIPNVNFKLVDKTTGQDLFWGGPYKASQLKMKHIINGVADSAILRADTTTRLFTVLIVPVHAVDTVTMQVANKPIDILLFKTGTTGGCCPVMVLNSVTYNGALVYTRQSTPQIMVLAK